MKDLIFVTWLYFQIVLVRCNIFDNNLNGSDAPIKMCIQKTINHLFSENDTLNLILNGSDLCEEAIFEMSTMRPYIVLNNEDTANGVEFEYNGQFIICPKDERSLMRIIYIARRNAQWNNRTMGNSKILVITNDTDASWMFKMFWYYSINNLIILVYGQGTTTLLTCNRFAPENGCGKTVQLIIDHDCEEELSLSFTSVIHQMNKCPVIFAHEPGFYEVEGKSPVSGVVYYVMREFSNHLNATYKRHLYFNESVVELSLRSSRTIIMSHTIYHRTAYLRGTEPLLRMDVVWMVPKARQISNMNAFVQVFNYDVWIAASVVFISAVLTWCLIISRNGGFTFDKLCISFLNVWSLTICGNVVSQLPRSLALRILLLFYLFYAINLQFAFTSDMSTFLTTPRYEFQIRNLEELADSGLPIYTYDRFKTMYFGTNSTDRTLYTKLQNSMQGVTYEQYNEHLFNLHLQGNYAVITIEEEMRNREIIWDKEIERYEIRDYSLTGVIPVRLRLIIDHYITTTLDTFISRMIESGLQDKRKNDLYNQHHYYRQKVETMQEDELTLKHLTFIFIFLGFGLCTACVVFCFELVLNKYL